LWEIEEQETNEIVSINTDLNPFKTSQKNPFIEKENSMTVDETVATGAKIRPKFLYDISGAHTATVNIVRFSPNGIYLASGGDDSAIVLWCQKSRPVEFGSTIEKVVWCNSKILRGHLSDIYDLAWSPDSKYLISGSVDNTATIFSVEKGKGIQKMADHSHFVQGVSWDPRNKYVTTQSSDKSVRVYKNADMKQEVKFYFANALKRNNDNNNKTREEDGLKKKDGNTNQNYFADEILCPSFIRRHCWSPDGSILLLVAGTAKGENEVENVVWGFTRKDLTKPAFMLPTLDKSSTVVRFCPILFNKDTKEEGSPELLDLPYKMVFAIGTLDSLYIYDTQDIVPKYAVTNIHFQPITDLAWKGSSILAASSSDGYITFCVFEKDELGKPADSTTLPEKSKFAYENYINCDIKKNLITNQSNFYF
jgi:chromatin assembly factor 1 subunit B